MFLRHVFWRDGKKDIVSGSRYIYTYMSLHWGSLACIYDYDIHGVSGYWSLPSRTRQHPPVLAAEVSASDALEAAMKEAWKPRSARTLSARDDGERANASVVWLGRLAVTNLNPDDVDTKLQTLPTFLI